MVRLELLISLRIRRVRSKLFRIGIIQNTLQYNEENKNNQFYEKY